MVRISNRSARVFWIPLTLDEARGVLTSLQIAYEPARNGTCTDIDEEDMQLMTITESLHTQSEAVIDGLLFTEEYCVAIQVSTRAGESGFSNVLRGHCKFMVLMFRFYLKLKNLAISAIEYKYPNSPEIIRHKLQLIYCKSISIYPL